MGKTEIKKKKSSNSAAKKARKQLNDLNLLESVNIKGLSDIETCKAYISRATELENGFKPEKALVFYDKCIEILNPKASENKEYLENLTNCLEASAYLLIDLDKKEEARERLHKVTVLNPDVGYEKYMFLAQLTNGENAVNLFNKGINLIESQLVMAKGDEEKIKKLSFDLSQTFCALAEIYMTDLCDQTGAEDHCQEYLEKAMKTKEDNPQSYLIAASFATVKDKKEEAKKYLEKCLELWWPPVKKFLDEKESEEAKKEQEKMDEDQSDSDCENEGGQIDLEEITGIPFEAHISMARNLFELEMYKEAADVLEVVLEENDEDPEIYYLLAHCGSKLNWKEENPEQLRYFATFCKVVSTKMDDKDVVEEMNAIISELPEAPEGDMEDFEIPDTDEDSDMYEGESMEEDGSGEDEDSDDSAESGVCEESEKKKE